jgi:hypothetical protein
MHNGGSGSGGNWQERELIIPPGTPAQLYVAKGSARADAFYRRKRLAARWRDVERCPT